MGTEVDILAVPNLPSSVVEAVKERFAYVEAHLSRFRPESDLSRLNASGGRPYRPEQGRGTVLREALQAARTSGGRFDPTVLEAVEASGYRRSFAEMDGCVDSTPVRYRPDYRQVVLNRNGTVVLKGGVRVDLGGYAKGWTIDAVEGMMQKCESWVVNAGGDLRATGCGPDGRGWLIGIEDPRQPGLDIGVIRVRNAAIATSSTARRRWRTEQGFAHHLIDPVTAQPATTGLLAVTVLADTAANAEVLAKTAFLMGIQDGLAYIESQGRGAVFVAADGRVIWSRRMEAIREA